MQLYKGGQSQWATGTDRGDTKPTTLNVQVSFTVSRHRPYSMCARLPYCAGVSASVA